MRRRGIAVAIAASGNYLSGTTWPILLANALQENGWRAVCLALGGWLPGWIYDVSGSYHLAFVNGIVWNGMNIAIIFWLISRSHPRAGTMDAA